MTDVDTNAYLPGAAGLIDQLDSKMMIVLRDGRNLIGRLRSFDQYMNLVIEETFERVIFEDKYCDIPLGLFILRGENIVVLGEVDLEKEALQEHKRISIDDLAILVESKKQSTEKINWDLE